MQLIFVTFLMILTFVTWTFAMHPRRQNITRQNDRNVTQKNFQINHATNMEKYNYALTISLWFFQAQRSGKMPSSNRIGFRHDSMLHDHGYFRENLSGGYYNSGISYVKYVFPTAFTTTMLAWGVLTWTKAYRHARQLKTVRQDIKWATDYFIKCHPQEELFYIQVGDEMFERRIFGRPENIAYNRPAYAANFSHPASDILGETAAALAATSIVFKQIFNDTQYSNTCLTHAKQLYKFALKYKGSHYEWMPNIYSYEINTYSYHDDLVWAALWLYRATRSRRYLAEAEDMYERHKLSTNNTIFNYYTKIPGIEMMFTELTINSAHKNAVKQYLDTVIHKIMRTEKGLAFFSDTDTLPLAANAAFLCLIVTSSDVEYSDECYAFAKEQIDYMLGIKTGKSYVVGFDSSSPTHISHKASSCPRMPANCGIREITRNESNYQILYGALVNGPDATDHFVDIKFRETGKWHTKVRIDYNAGFTGALAGLLQSDIRNAPLNQHYKNNSYDTVYKNSDKRSWSRDNITRILM